MASNHTEHYALPQWDYDDRILMDEFNGAMANIDTALHAKAEVVLGIFTGDNTENRFISLGVTPKAVLLFTNWGATASSYSSICGGLALQGSDVTAFNISAVKIVENGFEVTTRTYGDTYISANTIDVPYHYMAFV